MKIVKEECSSCGRKFRLAEKNNIFMTINHKYIKETNFIDHDHVCFCGKCSKKLLQFVLKEYPEASQFWSEKDKKSIG